MTHTKIWISIWAILALTCLQVNQINAQRGRGQGREAIKEKLNSQKIAFLTDKLELTEAEAEKFWPVYRAFDQERAEIRTDLLEENMEVRLSDKDAENNLNNIIELKEKDLALHKKYIQKFKAVIPAAKVVRLFQAEREFKLKVMEKLRERKQNRSGK
jgi:hypothetical protein